MKSISRRVTAPFISETNVRTTVVVCAGSRFRAAQKSKDGVNWMLWTSPEGWDDIVRLAVALDAVDVFTNKADPTSSQDKYGYGAVRVDHAPSKVKKTCGRRSLNASAGPSVEVTEPFDDPCRSTIDLNIVRSTRSEFARHICKALNTYQEPIQLSGIDSPTVPAVQMGGLYDNSGAVFWKVTFCIVWPVAVSIRQKRVGRTWRSR